MNVTIHQLTQQNRSVEMNLLLGLKGEKRWQITDSSGWNLSSKPIVVVSQIHVGIDEVTEKGRYCIEQMIS